MILDDEKKFLGQIVQDRITGYTGFCDCVTKFLAGSGRIDIVNLDQNADKDNRRRTVDIEVVKVLTPEEYKKEGIKIDEELQMVAHNEVRFDFMDEVRDQVTKYKGFVTAVSIYFNGCLYYLVTPKTPKFEKKPPDGSWIADKFLALKRRAEIHLDDQPLGGPDLKSPRY